MARGGAYAARRAEGAICSWWYLRMNLGQVSPRKVFSHTPAGDSYSTKRALNARFPSLVCILSDLKVSFGPPALSGGLGLPAPAPAAFVASDIQWCERSLTLFSCPQSRSPAPLLALSKAAPPGVGG